MINKTKLTKRDEKYGFYPPREVHIDDEGNTIKIHERRVFQKEMIGFIGWIITMVVYVFYIVWAYLPEFVLHAFGITYYPSKEWALRIPIFICLLLIFQFLFSHVYLYYKSVPLDSRNAYQDEMSLFVTEEDRKTNRQVPPMRDINIKEVNRRLYRLK